jgi:uncharacterized delta-60 repeat protein
MIEGRQVLRLRVVTVGAVAALACACAPAAMAADGDLYTGFSDDGKLVTDFGATDIDDPNDAVLDSSGRLVVVGSVDDGAMGVARINPSGTLDSTFGGGDGKVAVDIGPTAGAEFAQAVAIDGSGRIVIVGRTALGVGSDIEVARLEPDGDLDPTFDGPGGSGNGVFALNDSTYDEGVDVAIKGSGTGERIVVGATQTNTEALPAVTQLLDSGARDTAFGGGDGIFTFAFPGGGPGAGSFLDALAVQADGMILVAGVPNTGSGGVGLARVKADGSGLDTAGFNSSGTPAGLVIPPSPPGHLNFRASEVIVEPVSGNIVVGGTSDESSPSFKGDLAIARFTSAGALDATFGTGGQVVAGAANVNEFGGGLARRSDGSLLLGGGKETATAFVYDPLTARFTSGGGLDSTFGTGGLATTTFGQDARGEAMLFDPAKGVAYLVGSTTPSGGFAKIAVVALKAGIPDTPELLSTDPASPSSSLTPKIQGSVSGADTVWLFTNDQCTGPPVATGTQAEFNGAGIPVSVGPGTQTAFWAQAFNGVFPSDCSTANLGTSNIVYSVVPTAPVPASTDPASGANDNTPRVIGTGRSDSNTLQIFPGAGCGGLPVATGTLAEFQGPGIEVSVPDNSTTTFYARAVGTYGPSDCSATGVSYAEVTPLPPPPPPPVDPAGPTGQRAKALKKCAKIKKKAKKKRCKARARKLPL